jgi:hypothetical protein
VETLRLAVDAICCGRGVTAELLYQLSYRSNERSGQDSNLRPVDWESITARRRPAAERKSRSWNVVGCGIEPRRADRSAAPSSR